MTGFALKAGLRAAAPLRRAPPNALRRPNTAPKRGSHSSNSPDRRDPPTTSGTSIPIPATIPTLPLWQRLGPLTKAFEALSRSQRKRPWTTQFVSTLVIYFLGDMGAQSLRDDGYEPTRTARSMFIGAGAAIPTYIWFMYLGNSFNYASPLLSLATKVLVNQSLYTPLFNTYFFGMQSALSGAHALLTREGLMGVVEHVKRTVPISCLNSCKLWPAVTAFSFTFVPAHFRSLFGGVIAIGWQAYLSFLNRQAEGGEVMADGKAEQRVLAVGAQTGQETRAGARTTTVGDLE